MEKHDEMVSVPIESFFSGIPTSVDVYIALSETKFVLLFKAGHVVDFDQLKNYKTHQVGILHIRKDDYPKLVQKQIAIAGVILNKSEISNPIKTSILNRVAISVYEQFEKMGYTQVAFNDAREISKSVVNLINAKPQLLKLFETLNTISEEVLRHSMAVSFLSSMIGRELGWERRETLEKMSLGGMLHDIGKKEMSKELLGKSRAELSYDEQKEYENHPFRGMQLLSSIDIVPSDVISIVYEHHENSIGQGYPRRLWDMKLNPMSRVVALANTFCELTMGSTNFPSKKSPAASIDHIETVMGQPFNKEAFRALKRLLTQEESKKTA